MYKNILEVTEGYIYHQVNCQGVVGSGLAKQIKDKYPEVYTEYLQLCKIVSEYSLLGKCQTISVRENLCIVNVFGQQYYGHGQRFTSYDAIDKALQVSAKYNTKQLPHYFPRLGCGLGGGDWNVVKQIILSHFPDAILVQP